MTREEVVVAIQSKDDELKNTTISALWLECTRRRAAAISVDELLAERERMARELNEARAKWQTMEAHPDVRKWKLDEAKKKLAQAQAEVEKLSN